MLNQVVPSNNIVIDSVIIRQDAEGRYCLNDLHKAAGGEERHKPKYWLALQQTQELIKELTEGGIPPSIKNQPVSVVRGGDNQGTYVVKELVYSYAIWISAPFQLRVIRAYDKYSAYPMPQSFSAALRVAAEIQEKLEAAQFKIEVDKPKVEFAEAVRNVDGLCDVTEFAKAIGYGRNTFYAMMRDDGLLRENNQPYQRYLDLKIFDVIEETPYLDSKGKTHPVFKTMITGKGQVFLEKKYRQHAVFQNKIPMNNQLGV